MSAGLIKVAVMAVGGQGGGVLTGWIEALARAQGWAAQATSVAGVAQRTGATIYYIEMAPASGGIPVFSLAPSAGDVDILIAAEMMEVGRAILRGFVTPDRTVLIGSTHRSLAVSEKIAPGDGIANAAEVRAAAEIAARKLVLADFEALSAEAGSVISAGLFGALASSGALPFERASFEDAIRNAGKGVEASLRAFDAGFAAAADEGKPSATSTAPGAWVPIGTARLLAAWESLEARARTLPPEVQDMALAGLRSVVAFQDIAYGAEYLDLLERVRERAGAGGYELIRQAAKYIANAMAYDDVIRVAAEKTRAARFARIRAEMGSAGLLQLTDYTHPRGIEVVSLLPHGMGIWVEARPSLMNWIERRVNRGRRLRTDRVWPFLQLWLIAGLRRWRRGSLRHLREMAHMEAWLATALSHAGTNPILAVEMLKARRLIKGYGDTHARGQSKFDRVMQTATRIASRPDAADWVRRLVAAALMDEEGLTLDGAIRTIESL